MNKKPQGLPENQIRWNNDRQVWEIFYKLFQRNPDNPRSAEEYKPKDEDGSTSMSRLMDSIYAPEFGGIHQPVSCYIYGNRVHILDGHRRHAGVTNLCRIYPDEIDRLGWIPANLEPEPETRSLTKIKMLSSNNLKEGWNFREALNHFKNFSKVCKDEGFDIENPDIEQQLATAIGWNPDRLDAMIEISSSSVLCETINDEFYDVTTYKTWREVYHLQKILCSRPQYLQMLEGLIANANRKSKNFKEEVYKLLIRKVRYYVEYGGAKVGKSQAGAILERIAKPLRNPNFPVKRVEQWLTSNIDLTPWTVDYDFSIERPTESSRRNDNLARFIAIWTPNCDSLTEKELQNLMSQCVLNDKKEYYLPQNATPRRLTQISKIINEHAKLKRSKIDVKHRFEVIVPAKSRLAFKNIANQIAEIINSEEVQRVINPQQQQIFKKVTSLLK